MSKFWKILIAVIIVVAISVASTIGIIKYNEKKDNRNETVESNIMFQIGSLDSVGNITEENKGFVSKEFLVSEFVDNISLNEGATIYFRIAFFDLNKNFISISEKLTGAISSFPEGTKYLMLEFCPLNQDSVIDNDFSKFYLMLNIEFKG